MIDISHLDADTLSVIVDSLHDAIQGHESALEAGMSEDGNDLATELADATEFVLDLVQAGKPLTQGQISLITDALTASETNCRDLASFGDIHADDLATAADEYEAARIKVNTEQIDLDACADGCTCN